MNERDGRRPACDRPGCGLWPSNHLLAALIWQLPREGNAFPPKERERWLQMMGMTFDLVYGDVGDVAAAAVARELAAEAIPPAAASAAASDNKKKQQTRPPRFYVDHSGYARKEPGNEQIMPFELKGETLFDDRGEHGDLGSITWADGTQGVLGLQLDIAATPEAERAA